MEEIGTKNNIPHSLNLNKNARLLVEREGIYAVDTLIISLEEARKYIKQNISDERLTQIIGYLQGMAETIIKQERKNYEQEIKNKK